MKLIHYLALCILTLVYGVACAADNEAKLKEHLAKIIQQQQDDKQQGNKSADAFAGYEDDEEDPSLLANVRNKIAIEGNWIKKHPKEALAFFAAICGAIAATYGMNAFITEGYRAWQLKRWGWGDFNKDIQNTEWGQEARLKIFANTQHDLMKHAANGREKDKTTALHLYTLYKPRNRIYVISGNYEQHHHGAA